MNFTVYLSCPNNSSKVDRLNEERYKHMIRHIYAGIPYQKLVLAERTVYILKVNDCFVEDFLKTVPAPFVVSTIEVNGVLFYENYKIYGRHLIGPRHPFLKRLFWTAKSYEKTMPAVSR